MTDTEDLQTRIRQAVNYQHAWIKSVSVEKTALGTMLGSLGLIAFFGFLVSLSLGISGKNYGLEIDFFLIMLIATFFLFEFYKRKSIFLLKDKLIKLTKKKG